MRATCPIHSKNECGTIPLIAWVKSTNNTK